MPRPQTQGADFKAEDAIECVWCANVSTAFVFCCDTKSLQEPGLLFCPLGPCSEQFFNSEDCLYSNLIKGSREESLNIKFKKLFFYLVSRSLHTNTHRYGLRPGQNRRAKSALFPLCCCWLVFPCSVLLPQNLFPLASEGLIKPTLQKPFSCQKRELFSELQSQWHRSTYKTRKFKITRRQLVLIAYKRRMTIFNPINL